MKFKYYHLHSGVNIEQLEKTLLTQVEEFKDKKSHGKITFQNKLKPAMIVDIKPEHKKYITWMFRGSRKQQQGYLRRGPFGKYCFAFQCRRRCWS